MDNDESARKRVKIWPKKLVNLEEKNIKIQLLIPRHDMRFHEFFFFRMSIYWNLSCTSKSCRRCVSYFSQRNSETSGTYYITFSWNSILFVIYILFYIYAQISRIFFCRKKETKIPIQCLDGKKFGTPSQKRVEGRELPKIEMKIFFSKKNQESHQYCT